jgi:outer membrane protein insertion porin family
MDLGARARVVRRAQALAVSALSLALACSRAQPKLSSERDEPELASRRACAATALPKVAAHDELPQPEPPHEPLAGVEVLGAARVSPELVQSAMSTRPGQRIDPDRLADDVREIWRLEVFDDVRVGFRRGRDGLWLSLHVSERPLVGEVFFEGARERVAELGLERDQLYEPARLHRRARDLERSLVEAGFLRARVSVRGLRRAGRVDLCAGVTLGPRQTIERLEFVGNQRIAPAELRSAMHTEAGTINTPGAPYRAEALERDLLFMSALYYERGMLEVKIVPRVEQSERALRIKLEIDEGVVFRIGQLTITGELLMPRKRYRELVGVRTGEVFSRSRFAEGLDRIGALHRARGRDDIQVELSTKLFAGLGRVDIQLALVRS